MSEETFFGLIPAFPLPPEEETHRRRFYVVTRSPGSSLDGIWWCPWAHLEAHLPAPHLDQCRGVYLRGFDAWELAANHWWSKRMDTPPRMA